ncbi:MAG: ADP-ribosyltransferase [Paludibacter sp.]
MKDNKHYFLNEYLGRLSQTLNPYLRRKNKIIDDSFEDMKNKINYSLDDAISYSNLIVYRIDDPYEGLSFKLFSLWFIRRIDAVVEFPVFLSTTLDNEKNFPKQSILFKINTNSNSNGKLISSIATNYCPEGEVLFKSNTKFRIDAIDMKNELIILIELDSSCKSDYLLEDGFYLNEPEIRETIPIRKNKIIDPDFLI